MRQKFRKRPRGSDPLQQWTHAGPKCSCRDVFPLRNPVSQGNSRFPDRIKESTKWTFCFLEKKEKQRGTQKGPSPKSQKSPQNLPTCSPPRPNWGNLNIKRITSLIGHKSLKNKKNLGVHCDRPRTPLCPTPTPPLKSQKD